MISKHLWIAGPALALAAVALAGCGGGGSPSFGSSPSSPTTANPFTGTYFFNSIALGSNSPEFCSGSPVITLDSNGDEATCGPNQTVTFNGSNISTTVPTTGFPTSATFSVNGSTVTFYFTDGGNAQTAVATFTTTSSSISCTIISTTDPNGLAYVGLTTVLSRTETQAQDAK
jgi:hypothetical protein